MGLLGTHTYQRLYSRQVKLSGVVASCAAKRTAAGQLRATHLRKAAINAALFLQRQARSVLCVVSRVRYWQHWMRLYEYIHRATNGGSGLKRAFGSAFTQFPEPVETRYFLALDRRKSANASTYCRLRRFLRRSKSRRC